MKNSLLLSIVPVMMIFAALSGCANRTNLSPRPTIDPEAKEALEAPINCSTSERDIQVLEDEKASVGKQILSGVRAVVPFSAAAGILMGDYRERAEVATGKYNEDIEAKIAQIRQKCGTSL